MKSLRTVFSMLVLVLSFSAAAVAADDIEERSKMFIANVFSGKYEDAAAMISNSSSLKAVDNLADFGIGLRAALGDYKRTSKVDVRETRSTTTVVLMCDFENGQAKVTITYNETGRITAVSFKPVVSQAASK
ncbi:MAG: hypothetical protein CMR00_01765 [[Chlorobium] sp. 445]|nr:MAG: hypothetical protein CMR00_01765 [[Chlorobium] sp. 445]